MDTLLRIEDESIARESEPVHESSVHTIFLWKLEIGIDYFSREEAIVSRTRFEFEFWDSIENPIKESRSRTFPPRYPTDIGAFIVDDIISLLVFFYEFWDLLDWMLAICIKSDDDISSRVLQSCSDSEFFSEVAREIHSLHSCIWFTELLYLFPCTIRRAIIHEDNLEVIVIYLRQYWAELIINIGDISLFTICWYYEREELLGHESIIVIWVFWQGGSLTLSGSAWEQGVRWREWAYLYGWYMHILRSHRRNISRV